MAPQSGRELAQRLYESIADDERLRGALSDAGYGPILRWSASRALSLAESVDAAADIQALQDGLRQAVAALVEAAETGRAEALRAVDARWLGAAPTQRVLDALDGAPDAPDDRAAALVQALAEG